MISVSASAAAVPEPIEAKSSDGVNAPRFGHTFVVNVGYGGVRGLVFLLNTVTVAPVLLFRLGADQFAIFALVTPFLRFGFNGIFDMGLATAVVRHVSTAAASDDKQGINRYVATAACLYVFFGVALLLLYHFLAPQLIPLLVWHNAGAAATAQIVVRASLVIYIGFLFCNPFFALLMGIRQLHATHIIGMLSMLIEFSAILALIPFGITVSRVLAVYAGNACLSFIVVVVLARRHWPHLSLRMSLVSLTAARELLSYTARYSVTVSTTLLAPLIDKLLLTRFAGLSFVAAYEAAARLVEICRRATQLILLPLFPIAGAMERTSSEEQRHRLYQRVFGANVPLSAALFLLPIPFGYAVIRLWLGGIIAPHATQAFVVLSATALLLAIVNPAGVILAGTGRMKLPVGAGLGSLACNLTAVPAARGVGVAWHAARCQTLAQAQLARSARAA